MSFDTLSRLISCPWKISVCVSLSDPSGLGAPPSALRPRPAQVSRTSRSVSVWFCLAKEFKMKWSCLKSHSETGLRLGWVQPAFLRQVRHFLLVSFINMLLLLINSNKCKRNCWEKKNNNKKNKIEPLPESRSMGHESTLVRPRPLPQVLPIGKRRAVSNWFHQQWKKSDWCAFHCRHR